jgi:predicted N-formylglutamate amidohydrolase
MQDISSLAQAAAVQAAPALLGPQDPPPYRFQPGVHPHAVLLCDHASAAVPASLQQLGVAAAEFGRHIAVDLHAAAMTRLLAERLGLCAFFHGYSRLVVDANRAYGDAALCPATSDGTLVPGNCHLSEAARRQRWEHIHQPYHHAVSAWLQTQLTAGHWPAVLSIHSFTPELGGQNRRWPISVLWNQDQRLAQPFMEALRRLDGIDVGDNEPYSGRVGFGYSIAEHAESRGLPHLLIELRQDVIAEPAQRTWWADLIARRLEPLLADAGLYRRFDPGPA